MGTRKHVNLDPNAILPDRLKKEAVEMAGESTIYGPDNYPISTMDIQTNGDLKKTKTWKSREK